MKNFIAKLILVFKYNSELKIMLEEMREKLEEEDRILKSKHLTLCLEHQQESYRSHHSRHMCDYCTALDRIKVLEVTQDPLRKKTRMRGS
jgi:hypothetical protein